MNIKLLCTSLLMAGSFTAASVMAQDNWQDYLPLVRIKQAIAETLTPAELEERRERLARFMATQAAQPPRVGANICGDATNEIGALPFGPLNATTVGSTDNYDLPADTTAPTCTAVATCTGAGPAGSLPRGAIYTGTGTGPDFAHRLRTNQACDITITMDPTGSEDMALIMYPATCSSALADCGCVDDTGVGGVAEQITMTTVANTDFFVVADGYSTGATPPGPAGPFTLSVTSTTPGCQFVGNAMADLSITKTDGQTNANAGSVLTYTISASNAGPAAVTGASVADTFPAACTSVAWTCTGAGGGTCTANGAGNISDSVNLPVGASVTYTANCTTDAATNGVVSNTATVTAPGSVMEINPANNTATDTTTVAPAADLAITKTDGQTNANAGSVLTYTISASNAGPAAVTGASVADTFPAECASVAWTCTGAGGGTCAANGAGNISDSVNLPVGASVTYTANCTTGPATNGVVSNTATITAPGGVTDINPANNTATDTTTVTLQPGVLTTAPAATINFGGQNVGAGANSTLTISNTGAGPLQVTGIAAPTAPFSVVAGGTCAATPFTLAAGASCTVIYRFQPSVAGPFSQAIAISSDGGNVTVTLSGSGVLAIPLNTLSNWSLGLLGLLLVGSVVMVLRRQN